MEQQRLPLLPYTYMLVSTSLTAFWWQWESFCTATDSVQHIIHSIHHFATLNLYSVATYYNGKGQYFSMLGFIEEMAGPLSYANWILAKVKLTHLSIWRVNQQISVYLWHFRTMLEFYFFYTLIKNWSHVWKELPVPLLITASFSVLLMAFGLTLRRTKAEAKRLYRQYSRKISFYNITKPHDQERNKTQ